VEPVILAIILGFLTVIRSALRCAEILVRAHADNLRERARKDSTVTILTVMKICDLMGTHGENETSAAEPPRDPGPMAMTD